MVRYDRTYRLLTKTPYFDYFVEIESSVKTWGQICRTLTVLLVMRGKINTTVSNALVLRSKHKSCLHLRPNLHL